jgi:hypothetical protein
MAAIMSRMTIVIAFITIWCLLQSSIYCSPTPTTDAVAAVSDLPRETLDTFKNAIIDQVEERFKHVENKDIEDIDQAIKDLRGKKKINEEKHRKYSEHDPQHGNGRSDDLPPSNTIVTTIFIVSTETPTTIYSGNGGNAAKQQGSPQKQHQIGDPNSVSAPNNQTEAAIADQMLRDQSAYHKLVTALSIVGGFAAISLITAGLIYTRIRIRRRKRSLDLEKADSTSSFSSPPSPPTPPHQHLSRPPLSNERLSSVTFDDGNSTIIGYNQHQNPFADSNSMHPYKSNPDLQSNNLLPPLLPVHLESRSYITYRQNQTLSTLSQTTATAVPSAPTAKEIGVFRVENPFIDDDYESTSEEEYNYNQQRHRLYPPIASTRNDLPRENERTTHITPTQTHRSTLLQQQALQKSESSFSSLPPPPAYTPRAAPSAPPLYALPITTTTIEEQQQQCGEEDTTLRRHSISSCSIASSSSRPLFLRRGSGSRAHVTSIVS